MVKPFIRFDAGVALVEISGQISSGQGEDAVTFDARRLLELQLFFSGQAHELSKLLLNTYGEAQPLKTTKNVTFTTGLKQGKYDIQIDYSIEMRVRSQGLEALLERQARAYLDWIDATIDAYVQADKEAEEENASGEE